jgi:hypothetical protein
LYEADRLRVKLTQTQNKKKESRKKALTRLLRVKPTHCGRTQTGNPKRIKHKQKRALALITRLLKSEADALQADTRHKTDLE